MVHHLTGTTFVSTHFDISMHVPSLHHQHLNYTQVLA
jgi:hypothetical protein